MTETVYYGEVESILEITGRGGELKVCRLRLRHENRTLTRAIAGSVRVGDIITLLDCEREVKSRFK